MAEHICNNCRRELDNLVEVAVEKEPYFDYMDGCPYCGSVDILDKVALCVICGKTIYQEEKYYYCHETQECFCDDCIEERKE